MKLVGNVSSARETNELVSDGWNRKVNLRSFDVTNFVDAFTNFREKMTETEFRNGFREKCRRARLVRLGNWLWRAQECLLWRAAILRIVKFKIRKRLQRACVGYVTRQEWDALLARFIPRRLRAYILRSIAHHATDGIKSNTYLRNRVEFNLRIALSSRKPWDVHVRGKLRFNFPYKSYKTHTRDKTVNSIRTNPLQFEFKFWNERNWGLTRTNDRIVVL